MNKAGRVRTNRDREPMFGTSAKWLLMLGSGGAYANAAIIDLGDRTLVLDAFDTMAAGSDLRKTAEAPFDRPVDEAFQITLPAPFDSWMMGGMGRFEANVRRIFEYLAGQ